MQYKHLPNKPRLRIARPWKVLSIVAAVLLALGAGGYIYIQHKSDNKPAQTADGQPVNLDPPTDEEKQQAEDRKDEIVKEQNQPQPPAGEIRTVTPTIVDASQYDQAVEVRAFVNVVESDGKCTIIFKQNSITVTKEVAALADATTTRCTNLSVPRSEFASAGAWDVTVAYNSSKSQGSSSAKVTIQ